jgi:hypothetical protein
MSATFTFARPEARRRPAVTEPQLFYAPPYATPAEDSLAWALVRSLRAECGLRYQIPEGVNFMIESPKTSVAILIDSELANAAVPANVVYRLTAEDLQNRLSDVLYAISLLEPRLFDACERTKIRRNASPNLAIEFDGDDLEVIRLRYEPEEYLVEIEGEWIVLDPSDTVFETTITRAEL